MFGNGFGWPHLLIILVVVIILFGAKRLPDAARGVGKSLRIFKSEAKAMRDDGSSEEEGANTQAPDTQAPNTQAPNTQAQSTQQAQLPQSGNGSAGGTANGGTASPTPAPQRQNDVQA